MRVSELTSPGTMYDRKDTILQQSEISLRNSSVLIRLRKLKCDQFQHGYTFNLEPTKRSVCPVRALTKFLEIRNLAKPFCVPLFVFQNGTCLTRKKIADVLRLVNVVLNYFHLYKIHSFRIDAASTAAANSESLNEIQKAGRWRSQCFATYVGSTVPVDGLKLYR